MVLSVLVQIQAGQVFGLGGLMMDHFDIPYRELGKTAPPRPIRLKLDSWAGGTAPKVNGSEPRPWHCPPFVEGSTYGLELVYPYETMCQVVNDNDTIRFEWDFAAEPGAKLSGAEFGVFFPLPAKYYLFTPALDIKAPPGHALHTQPHPRFFTDDTGTVPAALVGHVQTEWWPKLFIVFKSPRRGERHIFRKGEPYVQILFLPTRMRYDVAPMDPALENERRELELAINSAGAYAARNVWHNPSGQEFKDHYKVMGRAFARRGLAGVKDVADRAVKRQQASPPPGLSIEECLLLARERQDAGRTLEARDIYFSVLRREPANAQAADGLADLAMSINLPELAVNMLRRAITAKPRWAPYRIKLANLLTKLGRDVDADVCFRTVMQIDPNNARATLDFALTLARLGRAAEALHTLQSSMSVAANDPMAYCALADALAPRDPAAARACYEAALAIDDACAAARQGIAAYG